MRCFLMAEYLWGTGRRKTSVARVRILPGKGLLEINGRNLEEYFVREVHQNQVLAPLIDTETREQYDVRVKTNGGGQTGQAEAIKLGIARALCKADKAYEDILKEKGHLTRDSRMVERKKFGRHKARRGHQTSKR